jgi:hypothetical protein
MGLGSSKAGSDGSHSKNLRGTYYWAMCQVLFNRTLVLDIPQSKIPSGMEQPMPILDFALTVCNRCGGSWLLEF